MTVKKPFYDVLEAFVTRRNYKNRQLDELSALRFGKHQHIPHETISRWRRGIVKKPRLWQDLVKLAIVLNLTESEADELLISAKHKPIMVLRKNATNEADKALLSFWDKKERPPLSKAPFQVPPDQPYFTGRCTELRTLSRTLKEGLRPSQHWGEKERETQVRIFCVQGMAGVGKTTLAIHLAYQLRDSFPDGVLWAQLERSDTMSLLRSFADAYGYDVSGYSDLGSRSSKVRELLAGKRALLVLDNAEEDEQIWPLLPPTSECAVIITTRCHDLWVANSAHGIQLEPFSKQKEESLALFTCILGDRQAQKELAALTEIADLLGHLPLAIAIAANRIKNDPWGSATKLLKRLGEQKKRLKELKRGNQGVRLSFDLSYHALPSDLQRFFATLGVFEGEDFTVEAAAYVAELPIEIEDAEDHLRELYNLSLLQLGRAGRYKLHPLLRDYSREKMTFAKTSFRMVTFFVDYIVKNETDYAALDSEMGNLLGALDVASSQDMKAPLVRGTIAVYEFLQARGLYNEAKSYLERAGEAARELGDRLALVSVLRLLGRVADKQGDYKEAVEVYQNALILARRIEHNQAHQQIAALLTSLGALANKQGDLAKAEKYYHEGLSVAQEADNKPRIAALLTNLGVMAVKQGDYQNAQAYYEQALQLARQIGHKRRLTITLLQNLGALMEDCGYYAQAKTYFREGLSQAREIGDPELKSRMLGNLGLVACALGDYAEAASLFKQGLTLAKQNGLKLQISRQLANLGLVASKRQDYEQANLHYKEALTLARQNGFPFDITVILNQWGECYLAQHNLYDARMAFNEALEKAKKAKIKPEMGKSLQGLAHLAVRESQISQAQRLGRESLAIFAAIGHKRTSGLQGWLEKLPAKKKGHHTNGTPSSLQEQGLANAP